MKFYLFAFYMTLQCLNSTAANAETVRWVTESWPNYTDEDGSGLYHDIVKAAFADHQLVITYMPWKRALLEVKNGTADITGATSFKADYITPRYAILAPPVSILFNKNNMSYSNLASLKNLAGVWAAPYEEELITEQNRAFIKGFSVQERQTAYKMLVSGRADYFVDTKALHQAWLAKLGNEPPGELLASDYQLEDISRLRLYMIFSNNERGQRLNDIFEQGMTKLLQDGQLQKIYEKYHFLEQMPPDLRQ
ncbi:MAG: polar amino acid transport system substrate-binding protein [Paraglaciecola sp.]|jgi:polar amino acid transport system substrate-binding protein